jgi:squalene-hopene/tetraprenyl-beta-curcumene cyclase
MLAQLGETRANRSLRRAIDYLRKTQLPDGSWYGRWGMNYIYGTWSVLCALNAAGLDHGTDEIRKAVEWLTAIQNPDGGWGEDGSSYKLDYQGYESAPSTASQTAWAVLGLMAAGEVNRPAVQSGIDYLLRQQGADGFWDEPRYTATGFPRWPRSPGGCSAPRAGRSPARPACWMRMPSSATWRAITTSR